MKNIRNLLRTLAFLTCGLVLAGCDPARDYTYSIDIQPIETDLPSNSSGVVSFLSDDQTIYQFDLVNGSVQQSGSTSLFEVDLVNAGITSTGSGLSFFNTTSSSPGQVFDFMGAWDEREGLPLSINAIRFEMEGFEPVTKNCRQIVYRNIHGEEWFHAETLVREDPSTWQVPYRAEEVGLRTWVYTKDCGNSIEFTPSDTDRHTALSGTRNIAIDKSDVWTPPPYRSNVVSTKKRSPYNEKF